MRRDLNRVLIMGRLGVDPIRRESKNGVVWTTLSVATAVPTAAGAEPKTDWHRVIAWGKLADICATYLKKGRTIFVEGSLRNSHYEDEGEKRVYKEIHADRILFLGKSQTSGEPPTVDLPEESLAAIS